MRAAKYGGTRLSSVGKWSREKLSYPPDGLFGISPTFKVDKAGEKKPAKMDTIRETVFRRRSRDSPSRVA